tara:strand:- start:283 stop:732 length:450 start_codon:yes stop_codon:yes gene_type:complete
MRNRRGILPGLCKFKSSPLKKEENDPIYQGGMLNEITLTDKYPNRKSRRKGEERKLTQELHKNPVIKAVHGKTTEAAKNIKTGVEHASTILPIGGVVKATKGTKKVLDTFNKIATHRAKQNKLIEESLKKKGWKIMPTKSSGWAKDARK